MLEMVDFNTKIYIPQWLEKENIPLVIIREYIEITQFCTGTISFKILLSV